MPSSTKPTNHSAVNHSAVNHSRGPSPIEPTFDSLYSAWDTAHRFLQDELNRADHWTGELSTSALSTATAVSALVQIRKANCVDAQRCATVDAAIATGCCWLANYQNPDGGFGDTDRSHSNIATTLLVLAAWEMTLQLQSTSIANQDLPALIYQRQPAAWSYVNQQGKWEGLRRRYGKDKTFVVPILSNCALAGLVEWSEVPALPFEAAWLPQDLYRWARMPVVSYAVPALVAIGQARFHFCPPKNPLLRALRGRACRPTLNVLRGMQPASGGYLEATPLTSFVLMSLAAAGNGHLPVAQDCLRFLLDSRLHDGSWPIDTNLATWLTSLSIQSLSRRGRLRLDAADESGPSRLVTPATVRWLLRCQHRQRHPFTGANPGGWGWTNLSGAVPDADDTPAALLALAAIDMRDPAWQRLRQQMLEAVGQGLGWLVRLQNKDGGWPTFCRGWGTLPFDRSGTDLTAHALRALCAWLPEIERVRDVAGSRTPSRRHTSAAMARGLSYLARTQAIDGSWLPLWFGNQDRADEDNPVYGTGKVLLAYGELGLIQAPQAQQARQYLMKHQNEDGGWGGGASIKYAGISKESSSTIEETAVALEGLLCGGQLVMDRSIMQALGWLANTIQSGNLSCSWPIGFYFAKLWYHERLYPAIYSLGALGAAIEIAKQQGVGET